jgi:hypothetical protein
MLLAYDFEARELRAVVYLDVEPGEHLASDGSHNRSLLGVTVATRCF